MLRRSILGIVAYAAAGLSAIPASARDTPPIILNSTVINLRCSVDASRDRPWTDTLSYRIDLRDSTVNGEKLRIDRMDLNAPRVSDSRLIDQTGAKDPKLGWHRAANGPVPAAYYSLNLLNGQFEVTFDDEGRGAKRFFRLRCTNKLLKLAA